MLTLAEAQKMYPDCDTIDQMISKCKNSIEEHKKSLQNFLTADPFFIKLKQLAETDTEAKDNFDLISCSYGHISAHMQSDLYSIAKRKFGTFNFRRMTETFISGYDLEYNQIEFHNSDLIDLMELKENEK